MPETINLTPLVVAIQGVNRNIGVVAEQIDVIGTKVDQVANEQLNTTQIVLKLYGEFQEYVEKDEWASQLITARQELSLVRQQLEKDFGHYAEVRRYTTGILQSVDTGVVRQETMQTATEELMMSCPGYWLAPSLVALSAWLSDNQALAKKAVEEAFRRDDSKASLFFALICRRGRRADAAVRWLVRYFQIQNPVAMDREVLIMLDALANGVFGGAAMTACLAVVDGWLAELEKQPQFADQERKRWATALDIMTPRVRDDEYPTLRKYSGDWSKLETSLSAARRNQVVQSFFTQMFTGEIVVAPSLEKAVDELLDSLVTNFDDRELPLRRKERFNEILIEADNLQCRAAEKRLEADRKYHSEADAFEEQTSFATLLTNSALYPERTGATKAAQRYAVSCSRHWIIQGFGDLTTRDRAKVPAEVGIACQVHMRGGYWVSRNGSWKGRSRDGSNERELTNDLSEHYANRIEQAVRSFSMTRAFVWAGVLALFGLLAFAELDDDRKMIGAVFMAAAIAAVFYFVQTDVKKKRLRAAEGLLQEQAAAAKILQAASAELTDIRREMAKEDKKSDEVLALLSALSSAEFVLNGPDKTRKILA